MLAIEAATGGTLTEGCTIAHFKAWLLGAMRLTTDGIQGGAPLVVLSRADLVAAMDPALVAESETLANGASFHFVVDPTVGHDEYAPRIQQAAHTVNGGAGKGSCGVRLCHACARGHCDSQSPRCSPAAARSTTT